MCGNADGSEYTGISTRPARVYPAYRISVLSLLRRAERARVTRREIILYLSDAPPGYRFFSSYLNTALKHSKIRSRAQPARGHVDGAATAAGRPAETPKHGDPSAGRYSVLRFIAVRAHLTLGVKRTSPDSSHTLLDPRPKI